MREEKSLLVTVLLWAFLGIFGAHRFYNGKIGTGVLMLCTGGGFIIGWLIDVFFLNSMRKGNYIIAQSAPVNVTVTNVVNGNDNQGEEEKTELTPKESI